MFQAILKITRLPRSVFRNDGEYSLRASRLARKILVFDSRVIGITHL